MIVNFLVLIHGQGGTASHMRSLEQCMNASLPSTFVLNSTANEHTTSDGIDQCARRLFEEIYEYYIYNLCCYDTIYFSICGHSLGGLVARYVIKLIYEHPLLRQVLEPVGITLVSSPNLGSRKPRGTILSFIANAYLKMICDKTGDQLLLSDPLLREMSEGVYIQALNWFPFKTLIAPIHSDKVVPRSSAMILHNNPFAEDVLYGDLSVRVAGYSGFSFDSCL
jgi:surfactin synthase thioesterase subunit